MHFYSKCFKFVRFLDFFTTTYSILQVQSWADLCRMFIIIRQQLLHVEDYWLRWWFTAEFTDAVQQVMNWGGWGMTYCNSLGTHSTVQLISSVIKHLNHSKWTLEPEGWQVTWRKLPSGTCTGIQYHFFFFTCSSNCDLELGKDWQ